ncbi:hypothetical protein L226DRAFT_470368 [Lentinus tigrinus ALCF2SS1-7]|uniref:Uncharacterized protein n=1 Tax=Lentinus tigrinus ALCF2SS1-6 TaxID=1328759 RepID=A0A5C2RWH7_9APHY|nr:hypothetical protein L227DRAFT_510464 [Lentinus tigrinus ALCF2SS1-6]RPD70324.1 hypothetical protein L226DRAFT_470368 [Lentinus tigrinus ALCF2SS1-7]
MPSDLNQELYLGGLLEGLKFTIVDVTPSVPDRSGWGATFSNPSAGSKTSNGNGDFDYLHCPFEIKGGEKIGTTKLTANSGLYSTGQGGKVDIKFHLEGKTTVNGSEVHINDDGYISVSASDWKGLERPDVSNVTYYWPNSPPCNAALTVPPSIAGMPDDIFFVHAAKPDAKELGMTSTTHQEVVDMVLNYAIRGIFWVNEKLFSWAIGPFKPF